MDASNLPDWPAALPLHLAAAYCGLSVDTFKEKCPLKPIRFTQSTRGDRYLRVKLDQWLLSMDTNEDSAPARRVPWGERLGGKAS